MMEISEELAANEDQAQPRSPGVVSCNASEIESPVENCAIPPDMVDQSKYLASPEKSESTIPHHTIYISEESASNTDQAHPTILTVVSSNANETEPPVENCAIPPDMVDQSKYLVSLEKSESTFLHHTMDISEESASNTDQDPPTVLTVVSRNTNEIEPPVENCSIPPDMLDQSNHLASLEKSESTLLNHTMDISEESASDTNRAPPTVLTVVPSNTNEIEQPMENRSKNPDMANHSKPAVSTEKNEMTSFNALALLQQYSESSGSDSSSDSSNEDEIQVVGQYRQPDMSSIAADSSSSESDDDTSSESSFENELLERSADAKEKKEKPPRVYGELLLDDLPPIEDLTITVSETDCILLGKISSIVDTLVVIQAFPYTPALDVETVLFLDQGHRTLGRVFDVFGQVTEPHYAVRFNSPEHIKQKGVELDIQVYCAPRTEHTSLVFVEALKRMKGSDASWKDDIEAPPECIDYSDDEQESQARRERSAMKRAHDDTDEPTQNGPELRNSNQQGNRPAIQQPRNHYPRPRGRGRGAHNAHPRPPAGHNPFYMRPPPFPNQQPYPFYPPPPPPQYQYSNWPPSYATPPPPGLFSGSGSLSHTSPWGRAPAPPFQPPTTNSNFYSNYNTAPGSSYPPPRHPPF